MAELKFIYPGKINKTMNVRSLFKTKEITIPKDGAQTVTELESWTVKWGVFINWGGREYYHKAFIKEADANEFKKQIEECAKFLKSDVHVEKYKN
jgi:hypothetical protein